MLQISLLLMKSQQNRDSHFLTRSVFFVSKVNLFDVYLAGVRSSVAMKQGVLDLRRKRICNA